MLSDIYIASPEQLRGDLSAKCCRYDMILKAGDCNSHCTEKHVPCARGVIVKEAPRSPFVHWTAGGCKAATSGNYSLHRVCPRVCVCVWHVQSRGNSATRRGCGRSATAAPTVASSSPTRRRRHSRRTWSSPGSSTSRSCPFSTRSTCRSGARQVRAARQRQSSHTIRYDTIRYEMLF